MPSVSGYLRYANDRYHFVIDIPNDFTKFEGSTSGDGRVYTNDAGDATLKVFLTASVEARAARRYKQLIQKGFSANMENLLRDLRERDARDTSRVAAPLKPAADAKTLDTSGLSIDQAVEQIIGWFQNIRTP